MDTGAKSNLANAFLTYGYVRHKSIPAGGADTTNERSSTTFSQKILCTRAKGSAADRTAGDYRGRDIHTKKR